MRIAAAALALATLFLIPATPAQATGNGEWAVTPTPAKNPGPTPRLYFFLDASPGQTVKESVRVTNLGKDPKSFVVYGADAYNTVKDGGFALRTKDRAQVDLGAWVSSVVGNVTVPAGASADIPFTITVPTQATPGDHVGGVVAMESEASSTAEAGGATVRIQRAVGARVYLRVAGTVVPGLSVSNLEVDIDSPLLPVPARGDFTYTVANIGNVHLMPEATVRATGLFGHRIEVTGSAPSSDMVPGAEGQFSMRAEGVWPFDVVTTSVVVKADGGVYARKSARSFVWSWTGVALIVLLAGGIWWSARRRLRGREARPRGLVAAG
ncbi:WxL protein peptidoglycan domain-containing protein [Actinoplanes subglobosus]|uniref:WxL protein peptidoglycan domain-containing protein n=1 Tax=Actinoplanes subglobosus TaxID=1547892 RepID=A0ABV8J5U3_9ACTN